MPYRTCPSCGLEQYSAAAWSTQDRCPSCDGPLRFSRDWAMGAAIDSALHRDLAADAKAPEAARRALETLRPKMDLTTMQTSRLLVSELVANGVEHGPNGTSAITLRASVGSGRLHVEVTNPGDGLGTPSCEPDAEALEHWGLFLVDDLSDRWGAEANPRATSVWFEIDGGSLWAEDAPEQATVRHRYRGLDLELIEPDGAYRQLG
jgi:anti-sigma regulatory factor (Ser/Thr protein kinase)